VVVYLLGAGDQRFVKVQARQLFTHNAGDVRLRSRGQGGNHLNGEK